MVQCNQIVILNNYNDALLLDGNKIDTTKSMKDLGKEIYAQEYFIENDAGHHKVAAAGRSKGFY